MVVKLIFENFDKFCSCICIYQKMFVSLQPNLDLSSIWGCSESHRSRDVKPWLPYLLGARKQKTVPSVEQAGANPARHIVAKAKEGLPSYAESNESVYWRLWFDFLKPRKCQFVFRMQEVVDAHGCIYTHAYLFQVRVRMQYTRGFLHVFRRYWFSQDHNGRITFSYPRFYKLIHHFSSIWNTKSSFL